MAQRTYLNTNVENIKELIWKIDLSLLIISEYRYQKY